MYKHTNKSASQPADPKRHMKKYLFHENKAVSHMNYAGTQPVNQTKATLKLIQDIYIYIQCMSKLLRII